MAAKSDIEWTDASWTPIRARNRKTGKVGWHCEHATTGCEFCYAESMNKRLGTGLPFKPGHRKDVEIFLDEEMLTAPLRWKRPRMVFCCSMTDLFADFVKDEWIDKIFAVMALCPQHTFQVLTKRAERMRDYVQQCLSEKGRPLVGVPLPRALPDGTNMAAVKPGLTLSSQDFTPKPLSNIWLGVSCERQQEADERRDYLAALARQGWLTFVSYEPALGMVDWSGWEFLKWLISGGESGPRARPNHPDWHRAARNWCAKNGIAYFFKQRGEYTWIDDASYDRDVIPELPPNWRERPDDKYVCMRADGSRADGYGGDSAEFLYRVGKHRAGRRLDGREHNEFPDAARSAGTLTEPVESARNPLS